MSKILIVNSSVRKNSNSTELGLKIAEGAAEQGNTVTSIDIGKKTITPCRGCPACLRPENKPCIIKDDMQEFYPLIQQADVIIFVSPIYWFTLGGQIKQFIDRCFGSLPADKASFFAAKKIGAAFMFADEDVLKSGCANAIRALQDCCTYIGAEWTGAIYGSAYEAGAVKTNETLLQQAHVFGTTL